ncbi:MAG: hypothetical protein AVDCRST_MAG25-727 [uncultured Rubrobacteraceae bacterium]|uniref:Uncharacterized protein n=1 Tax=uncultured Rubrobacteraceae bacterium TaxID=349277 RepID=A0A6J4R866_9ACTN|nr:MAG: hypothetical protein AVDCRST_MAG25-727 [uncultured Rubrobacteraceae bacterium]
MGLHHRRRAGQRSGRERYHGVLEADMTGRRRAEKEGLA